MSTRHRTPLLGNLRSYPDPTASLDPRVRLVVAQLRTLSASSSAPCATFRAELRQQLVAITPRLVAESVTARPAPASERPAAVPSAVGLEFGVNRARSLPGHVKLRRPLIALLSAAALFVMLIAGAVLMSGHAVPGDSLYGIKRANENLQLSLITGDDDRGKSYLDLAQARADEISELLSRSTSSSLGSGLQASGGISEHTAGLVTSTLNDQDSETRSAAQLLGASAVDAASTSPLQSLISWAPGQLSRLQDISARIPASSLHDRAMASVQVTQQALERADELASVISLPCLSSTSTDDFGPIPVSKCAPAPTPATSTTPNGSVPSSTPTGSVPSSTPTGSVPSSTPPGSVETSTATVDTPVPDAPTSSDVAGPTASDSSSDPSSATEPTQPTETSPVPSVPPPTLPTDPISTDTCTAQVNVDLATCGVSSSPPV